MSRASIRMNVDDLNEPTDGPKPAEERSDGDPRETTHVYYERGGVVAGVWECTPGSLLANDYACDEICTVISGKVGLVNNDDGAEDIYGAGDTFFVPKGANTTWVIYDTLRKYFLMTPN